MPILTAQAFTVKYPRGTNVLITSCLISKAFNPNTHPSLHPTANHYQGLWDTGATNTVITQRVVDELGLIPTGVSNSFHANGQTRVNTYLINIVLPNGVGFQAITVAEGILNGFDVLIGMDIITQGDFSVTHTSKETVFSFQIPPTHLTDYVQEYRQAEQKRHQPIVKDKLPGRNDPCHCGSDKKYKDCHGR
ncbi:MAG: hypothetical protein BGN96_05125 [Bacteroidales bacterium 45-6]|nr:MAG: hypothetical protein BGN96_05125 [Bacteroidales bacterium 45-6]